MSTLRAVLAALAVALVALGCSSPESSGFVPSSGSSGSTELSATEVRVALDQLIQSGVPGGVVAVDQPGGGFVVSSGVADLDSGAPIGPDTPVAVGGATTAYVAAALLDMADDGLVDLGDSVEDHLPGLLSYGWDVALFDLLQHIAGVPDYYAVGEPPGVLLARCLAGGPCELSAEDALAVVDDLDSEFQPGEGWGWSNSNYRVVELIIEEVSGRSWSEEVTERMLEPLALNSTLVPGDWSALTGLASGYADLDGDGAVEDVTALLPYAAGANGAITTTANELLAFLAPLLSGDLLSKAADVAFFAAAPTGFGSEEYGHGVLFPGGEEHPINAVAGEALGYSIYAEHDRTTSTTTVIVLNRSGGIDADLWGNLVSTSTDRERCNAEERDTTVPGGLRLYCAEPARQPCQSID